MQTSSLADTYGALFIGNCVGLMLVILEMGFVPPSHVLLYPSNRLYGLIIHQTYRYFHLYPGDPAHLKALVCLSNAH